MDSHKLSRTQIKNVALSGQWGAWLLGAEAALNGCFQEYRSTIPGGEHQAKGCGIQLGSGLDSVLASLFFHLSRGFCEK